MALMLRVAVMGAIALFWAAMWTLLIRSELRPAETALRALPPAAVVRQYFQHEQASSLYLREHGENIGHLRLAPKATAEGYALAVLGGLQFRPPGGPPQRSVLEGTLQLDREFHPRSVQGTFMNRATPPATSPPVRVEFSADLEAKRGHYRYLEDRQLVLEQDFTLDQAGLEEVLRQWGIGPEWKKQVPAVSPGASEIEARQVRLTVRDEPTDATQLTVRLNGQTWAGLDIGPLGQILEIRTLWGWTLTAD